jgi:hypothetical protein
MRPGLLVPACTFLRCGVGSRQRWPLLLRSEPFCRFSESGPGPPQAAPRPRRNPRSRDRSRSPEIKLNVKTL